MIRISFIPALLLSAVGAASCAGEPLGLQRCELVPLPGHQVSFRIDGVEKTRWHFGQQYPRPFFYPFAGPSGVSLTRMGHPGAPDHDHHRSVWIAHARVDDKDFWSDGQDTRVRQRMWYGYRDGNREAMMAAACEWRDPSGERLMEQELVAALIPLAGSEHALEIQITVRPSGKEAVELGKTNFGFLAVRVARTISVHFGGGTLTSSERQQGERAIFSQRARWVDYSGPVAVGRGSERKSVIEGITYFDHPDNPRYPTYWHVREDGWMGAAFCLREGLAVTDQQPLTLRYLLHAHGGGYDHAKAQAIQEDFAARPRFDVVEATRPHQRYDVRRQRLPDTAQ